MEMNLSWNMTRNHKNKIYLSDEFLIKWMEEQGGEKRYVKIFISNLLPDNSLRRGA